MKIFFVITTIFLFCQSLLAQKMESTFQKNEDKMIVKLEEMQSKGKLSNAILKRLKKGTLPNVYRVFTGYREGGFRNGVYNGTQECYNALIYDGLNNKTLTRPNSFGGYSYYLFRNFYLSN